MSVAVAGSCGWTSRVYPCQCGGGGEAQPVAELAYKCVPCASEAWASHWKRGGESRNAHSARLPCVGGVRAASELLGFGRSGVAG